MVEDINRDKEMCKNTSSESVSNSVSKNNILCNTNKRSILSSQKQQNLYKLIYKLVGQRRIKIGINETIKAMTKNNTPLIILANDSNPLCLTESLTSLADNLGKDYVYVDSKSALGKACRLSSDTIACAIYIDKEIDDKILMKDIYECM